jgi:hypothetical protein
MTNGGRECSPDEATPQDAEPSHSTDAPDGVKGMKAQDKNTKKERLWTSMT